MLKRLGLGLLIGMGVATAASAQAPNQFDGQYAGELTLAGIIKGDCTTPPTGARYPLLITGGVVRFKYVPRFDTTLLGSVDAKGNFKASRRLKRGLVSMTGHIDERHGITASITSPSCRYSFQTRE